MNILYFGSSNPSVELLQAGLNRAGFEPGKIDGIYGIQTRKGC